MNSLTINEFIEHAGTTNTLEFALNSSVEINGYTHNGGSIYDYLWNGDNFNGVLNVDNVTSAGIDLHNLS